MVSRCVFVQPAAQSSFKHSILWVLTFDLRLELDNYLVKARSIYISVMFLLKPTSTEVSQ